MVPEGSGSASRATLSVILLLFTSRLCHQHHLPSSHIHCQHLLFYFNSAILILSPNPLSLKFSPLPFSAEHIGNYPLKIKPPGGQEAKPLISYTHWTKAELQAIVKDFPKVTKDLHRFPEKCSRVIQT